MRGNHRYFAKLISEFSRHGCSNPYDLIYGLIGLVAQSAEFDIDYCRSPWGLLSYTMLHCTSEYQRHARERPRLGTQIEHLEIINPLDELANRLLFALGLTSKEPDHELWLDSLDERMKLYQFDGEGDLTPEGWRTFYEHTMLLLLYRHFAEITGPEVLKIISGLARSQGRAANWNDAELLELHVFQARKQMLGDSHPDTLTSMAELAAIYMNQGRLKEAEELLVPLVESHKQIFGPEHLDTLYSMQLLSEVYWNQGRYDEDEALLNQLLEIRTRVQGIDHPDTLCAMNGLAVSYRNQGQFIEAETLGKRALEARKRVLGDEHPETLSSISSLVLLYHQQGRLTEAEEVGAQLLETRKRVLGPENFYTLKSMHNLAHIWKSQGQDQKALGLMVDCIELRERVCGQDHPDTKASKEVLNEWQPQLVIDTGVLSISIAEEDDKIRS
jgi:tetratricopeptide (TPR) repeat protein